MIELQYDRRGHSFLPDDTSAWKPLYATEEVVAGDKVIEAHFFVGAANWYLVEFNPVENLAFGYADLGDPSSAEWGYFSLDELEQLDVHRLFIVERDLQWTPKPAREVLHPRAWQSQDM